MRRVVFPGLVAAVLVVGCSRESDGASDTDALSGAGRQDQADVASRRAPTPVQRSGGEGLQQQAGDPAFVALSDEERRWLANNGFLTQARLDALQALGEAALLERSREANDREAATALGLLRQANGDTAGAIRALDRAARQGSLYALEQLAFSELQDSLSVPGIGIADQEAARVRFVARMEQARLMGDHRVDAYIRSAASDLDLRRHADHILEQTTEYIRQMDEDAAIKGLPARKPDPRPNPDARRG